MTNDNVKTKFFAFPNGPALNKLDGSSVILLKEQPFLKKSNTSGDPRPLSRYCFTFTNVKEAFEILGRELRTFTRYRVSDSISYQRKTSSKQEKGR